MDNLAKHLQNPILLLVRVLTGYMFLLHGTAKFFEFPVSMTEGHGAIPLFSLFGAGGVLEIAGGVLLVLGRSPVLPLSYWPDKWQWRISSFTAATFCCR